MHRDYSSWWSPRLGMDMPIVRYGNYGPALLIFPTWQSDLWESESKGLIGAISPLINAGRLSVFCVNSISPHAWCNDSVPIHEKTRRQAAFNHYIEDEVVPHIRRVLGDPFARIGAAGASFGAFFAGSVVFRRPDLFSALIGMSGFYSLDHLLHGYKDEDVYFHSPGWFVPQLTDGPQLDLLRHKTQLHLLSGRGAHEDPRGTELFAGILRDKGIPHWLDIWGYDMPHDWPTWQRMMQVVCGERLGI